MQRFQDLRVWQKSYSLALKVYRFTRAFPDSERFGMTPQLRRAALSISTNIAEGSRRVTRRDYARFLNIAEGSVSETASLTLISRDLGFLGVEESAELLDECERLGRMLFRLRGRVEAAGERQASNP